MADTNVGLTVSDPDRLLAGTHPLAPFVATRIQLYRWATEALARAGSAGAGALVTTFTIVASTLAVADPNISGPFRFRVYDSGQVAGSCYRYRFADTGLLTFSVFSEMWRADDRASGGTQLRTVLYELALPLGESIERGTAAANAATNLVICTALFQSTYKDAKLFQGAWIMVITRALGTGAPELEEAQIASLDTTTGTATLERALTVAVTTGDTILVSYWIQPSKLIKAINLALEKMQVLATQDIALSAAEDRYPAPYGIKAQDDVVSAVGIRQYSSSNREDEFAIDYRVVEENGAFWIEIVANPARTPVARFRVMRSYRDLEGALALMADVTNARIEWLRPAAAYEAMAFLAEGDPDEPMYAKLLAMRKADAASATEQFKPKRPPRSVRHGAGRRVLPGPAMVA